MENPSVVIVLRHGIREACRRAAGRGFEAVRALARVPAVVPAELDDVDLLPVTLPDVADPEFVGVAVERPAPGIAEAKRKDLGTCRRPRPAEVAQRVRREWIAARSSRRRIRRAARPRIDVDAQHLAEQSRGVLRVSGRVAGAAAVTDADVQESVRTEGQLAAVVVGRRLVQGQQHAFRSRIQGLPAVGARELRGHRANLAADGFRVVEKHPTVDRKFRVEGHAQQSGFPLVQYACGEVDEHVGRCCDRVVLKHLDAACLLDDVPARSVVRRLQHRDGRCESEAREDARRFERVVACGRSRNGRWISTVAAAPAGDERDGHGGWQQTAGAHRRFPCPAVM